MSELSKLTNEDLECLLRIRSFESALLELFSTGQLSGTTHTCLGQEYIPVALRALLSQNDFVFSNHRGHGHYLARFDDVRGLLAEIMGREGAVCHGVGGSQHVYRQRSFLSTGVQGESLAVAAGVAFHFKRYGRTEVALVYVGDGTWGEGIVYESLNLAALWQLPLVVVVENNRIAQSTPITMQMAGSIEGRVRAFGIEYERVSISDINAIRQHLAVQFERSRHRRSPLVIEFETFRLGPHSKGDDTRTHAQIEDVRRRDVVTRYAAHFPEQYAEAQASVDREMDAVVKDLLGRGPSTWDHA